jgi:hypothetical protein
MIILSNIPQRQPDYQLEAIDDELLLFHPAQTTILYCNPTASLIWQLCDGQRTIQEIIDLLTAAYPEAKDTLSAETQATLEQFQQQGAIQFV